jgi:hypothetical protein
VSPRVALCAALLLASPLAAQQRLVRAMSADPNVAIRLWIPAGFVEVKGWDHDSVDVRVTPAAGTSLSGGGTRSAAKFALETTRGDSVLASGMMRVMVPRGARISIKSTTASVNVQGVRGEVDVLQVSGSISILDGRGVVWLESIAGDITASRIQGAITIRGGAGKISMTDVSGTLQSSAVSGSITLGSRMGSTGPLPVLVGNVETVGGAVMIIGNWHSDTRLNVVTHDGPVSVIALGAPMPKVESQVPGASVPAEVRDATGAGGVITVRSFKGKLNVAPSGGI